MKRPAVAAQLVQESKSKDPNPIDHTTKKLGTWIDTNSHGVKA